MGAINQNKQLRIVVYVRFIATRHLQVVLAPLLECCQWATSELARIGDQRQQASKAARLGDDKWG